MKLTKCRYILAGGAVFFLGFFLFCGIIFYASFSEEKKVLVQAENQAEAFLKTEKPIKVETQSRTKKQGAALAELRAQFKSVRQSDAVTQARKQVDTEKRTAALILARQQAETLKLAKVKTQAAQTNFSARIQNQFSPWDGSHRKLTSFIKRNMNDPGSYKHINTLVVDKGTYLIVKTTYRGKNGFGAIVRGFISAIVDLNGNVTQILAQG